MQKRESVVPEGGKKRRLPVIHTLGGCGGTLVAQCIGSMPGIVLISESNPASSQLFNQRLNPYTQVRDWYPDLFANLGGLFSADSMSNSGEYRHFIERLADLSAADARVLVVRDYNYIDYYGVPFVAAPARQPSLLRALEGSFDLTSVLLIRHPLDQYNSLRSHEVLNNVLSPDIFLSGYKAFLRDFSMAPLVKYESIVDDPPCGLRQLCLHLDIPYREEWAKTFFEYRSVTGNFRRIEERSIALPSRRTIADAWAADLRARADYRTLLAVLGYA